MDMGKKHLHAGNLKKAELCFLRALELANDSHSSFASRRGIITHRLAVIAAKTGDTFVAERRFKRALGYITDDPMGKAICLRDYGNFELLRGNTKKARRLNLEALKSLDSMKPESVTKRLSVERLVTEGFIARVDFVEGKNLASAIQKLRLVASMLHEYDRKPAYELANLLWLVEILPPGHERDEYLARARELSSYLGNTYTWGELQALTLGAPARSMYRHAVKVASFGVNTLKGIIRLTK